MKNIIFISGIGRNSDSYKKLFLLTPENYKLHFLNSNFLMNNGPDSAILEIEKYISKNNLNDIVLAGHSLGGGLALLYASRFPQRISHLFLIDSIGIHEPKSLFSDMIHFLHPRSVKETVMDMKAALAAIKHPALYYKLARYVRKVNLKKESMDIKVPTTIIWGGHDQLISVKHAEMFGSLIKNSRVVVLPTVSHDWPIYSPELFWENIKT